jgi:hypothetical protein
MEIASTTDLYTSQPYCSCNGRRIKEDEQQQQHTHMNKEDNTWTKRGASTILG